MQIEQNSQRRSNTTLDESEGRLRRALYSHVMQPFTQINLKERLSSALVDCNSTTCIFLRCDDLKHAEGIFPCGLLF
jgi:hypothetical protein